MASLIKQKEYWYAQFYCAHRTPNRKQVALKTKRKRVAERVFRQLEDEFALGTYDPWVDRVDEGPERLGDAMDAFLLARKHLRPETQNKYRSVIGQLRDHLGASHPVARISTADIQSFLDAKERKAVTRKTYSTTLSPFFNWLRETDAVECNPVSGVRLERVPRGFARYLSREQFGELLLTIQWDAAFNPRVPSGTALWIVPVIEATVYLGLRASEVCNVRWEDLDFGRKTLTLRHRRGFETKSGKERTLPLPAPALAVLHRMKETGGASDDFVFKVSPSSGQLTRLYLSRRFKHYARLADLPEHVCFHTLRHTCASWLAESGCSVEAIRQYLGHSSIRVTQRYMHLSPNAVADQIESAFAVP